MVKPDDSEHLRTGRDKKPRNTSDQLPALTPGGSTT